MKTVVQQGFTASQAEVGAFAALSNDFNRLHVDDEYAKDGFFGEPVVHGVFALSWVSGCIADLPVDGDVILRNFEDVTFKAPIAVGEPVEVKVKYRDSDDSVQFKVFDPADETAVKLNGTASVYIAPTPEEDDG